MSDTLWTHKSDGDLAKPNEAHFPDWDNLPKNNFFIKHYHSREERELAFCSYYRRISGTDKESLDQMLLDSQSILPFCFDGTNECKVSFFLIFGANPFYFGVPHKDITKGSLTSILHICTDVETQNMLLNIVPVNYLNPDGETPIESILSFNIQGYNKNTQYNVLLNFLIHGSRLPRKGYYYKKEHVDLFNLWKERQHPIQMERLAISSHFEGSQSGGIPLEIINMILDYVHLLENTK
jgi:hypothetical protein